MGGLTREGSLGSILLACNIITEADIQAALDEQQKAGCRFGEALVRLGIVDQEDIDWALASQLNIAYVRLKKEMIDPVAVQMVPGNIARAFGVMPLIRIGDVLSVAMIDPLNKDAIAAVEQHSGCQVDVSVALVRELREMHELFYGASSEPASLCFVSPYFPADAVGKINEDLSGARLVDYLLTYLVQQKLQTLSLQPVGELYQVIARKGAVSREVGSFPCTGAGAVVQRFRRLAGIDGSLAMEQGTISFRFRATQLAFNALFLRCAGGDMVTISLQILSPFPASIAGFAAPAGQTAAFLEFATLRCGLVLCASGDAADRARLVDLLLDDMDTAGRTVLRFGEGGCRGRKRFPRVPRLELPAGEFAAGIVAALEHEPDVVAIDDAGDEQVLIAAGKVAMKGRLAIAGVPFNDLALLFRFLAHLWHRHHFVPGYLKGVVVCRGILLLCPECRQEYVPEPDELAILGPADRPDRFMAAAGCQQCGYTGHGSRRYLLEAIPVTAPLIACLEASRDGSNALRYLQENGHPGILAQARDYLKSGEISLAEYVSTLVL